jgi:hypothetical protein
LSTSLKTPAAGLGAWRRRRTDAALRLAASLTPFWTATRRLDEDSDWFDRVLALPAGDEVARGRASFEAGMLAFWKGDDERSSTLHGRALELGRRARDATVTALALGDLARVALRASDIDEARRLCREALAVSEGTDDRRGDDLLMPWKLNGLAAVAAERCELERAATLIGAAEAMLEAQGAAWPPNERPHYERTVTLLGEAMGPPAFERARAAGRPRHPVRQSTSHLHVGRPGKPIVGDQRLGSIAASSPVGLRVHRIWPFWRKSRTTSTEGLSAGESQRARPDKFGPHASVLSQALPPTTTAVDIPGNSTQKRL